MENNFSIDWVRGPIISGCFEHIIFTEFMEQEAPLRLCLCSWAGFYLVAESEGFSLIAVLRLLIAESRL